MPHPRWLHFSNPLYIEARLHPEPDLKYFRAKLDGPALWVCLGIGLASVTVGITLAKRHTKRHTREEKQDQEAS